MEHLHESTFGHLLLLVMKHGPTLTHAHAPTLALNTLEVYPHSLEMTTFVTLEAILQSLAEGSITRILCGTDRGVVLPARAVSSTHLPGSARNFLQQLLMTLS